MTTEQIQLWTDSTQSNFAIFFDSNFVANEFKDYSICPYIN